MPCDCGTPKGIAARKKRKMEIKKGINRTKLNMKRKTCMHCAEAILDKDKPGKICGLTHKSIDYILKTEKFKCPLDYFN